MGHETYQNMLDRLVWVREAKYASDPDRADTMIECMESILQTMLEKLRDNFEPH